MTLTNLHEIPTAAARSDPDGIAYRFMDRELTFAELEKQVAQLVFVLQKQGVKPGDRVAICLRKSIQSAIAAFAIMGAGGVYVPLDPTAPAERWAQILNQSGARHLVSDRAMQARIQGLFALGPDVRFLIGVEGVLGPQSSSWAEINAAPRGTLITRAGEDPAYIMFTSGSTGVPKGMVHTHASGLSYLRAVNELFQVAPTDQIALHAGLHFDVSLMPMFGAPLAGGTCVIVPDAFTRLPAEMSKLIESAGVTIWYSVPFALIQMLEHGALDKRDASALRWVIYAGEPFPPDPLRALMNIWPQARFSNQYGPAEVNAVTYMNLDHADDVPDGGVPIGRAFSHTQALIVDPEGKPVACGKEGELVFATAAMMQGYWGDAALTAASMLNIEGVRYYRSGDIAVDHGDGVFHMAGRKDRQIKVRGARIELDEVELALNTHPDVLEAAALPAPSATGIIAAVVLRPDVPPDTVALRSHVAFKLPPYGVPNEITVLASFPRTGSGKIDRRAIATALAKN